MRRKMFFSPELLAAVIFVILTLCFSSNAANSISVFINAFAAPSSDEEIYNAPAEAEKPDEPGKKPDPAPEVPENKNNYVTPEDILDFEKEYLETYSKEKAFGNVKEKFFVNDASTFVSGNIAVRNTTEQEPDFEKLLKEGFEAEIDDKTEPLVLIFHTHTTEGYLLSDNGVFYESYKTRSLDPLKSIVRVGDAICEALRENGIGVIHDTAVYDSAYTGAYSRSREGILRYMEEYPSIKIVLDIHRDAIYSTATSALKPTAVINGKKAAQIMIITGAEEGSITDFPDWEKNLSFALSVQRAAQDKYEGLMKPIYFCRRKYNMDVTPCSLLLEFGSDTNTLEEAVFSGRLFGEALSELIDEYS
ncbi:MAG: stage II sporulation protein P [Oscillospiraceae bacterium]|nr:stage II sporulation protein P [Oscillospiraceae bacterium]